MPQGLKLPCDLGAPVRQAEANRYLKSNAGLPGITADFSGKRLVLQVYNMGAIYAASRRIELLSIGERKAMRIYNSGTLMKISQVVLASFLLTCFVACNKPAANTAAPAAAAQPAVDPNATIPPKFVSGVNAPFPDNLWNKPGTVTVAATVGTDGTITETKVVSSPHPELNDLATNAVKQWKFESAKKNGQAVPFTITVNLKFEKPAPGTKVQQMPPAKAPAASAEKKQK